MFTICCSENSLLVVIRPLVLISLLIPISVFRKSKMVDLWPLSWPWIVRVTCGQLRHVERLILELEGALISALLFVALPVIKACSDGCEFRGVGALQLIQLCEQWIVQREEGVAAFLQSLLLASGSA